MGLDIWFREDVKRILAGLLNQAMRQELGSYRQGYTDALEDVAVSFGVAKSSKRSEITELHVYDTEAGERLDLW